jgi:mRNA-degrading endonuclease toxin of MazEF toxin-antitoxin module
MRSSGLVLTAADVVWVDLAACKGPEAGLQRPAVIVTAQRVLTLRPRVYNLPLARCGSGRTSQP